MLSPMYWAKRERIQAMPERQCVGSLRTASISIPESRHEHEDSRLDSGRSASYLRIQGAGCDGLARLSVSRRSRRQGLRAPGRALAA